MAKSDRDELRDALREYGGTHQRTIRDIGKPVGDDNVTFERETIEVETPEGLKTAEMFHTRRCDSCSRAIDQNNAVVGRCSLCSRVVCSAEGPYHCRTCGVLICRRDAKVYGENRDQIYCRHHGYRYWLRKIFL